MERRMLTVSQEQGILYTPFADGSIRKIFFMALMLFFLKILPILSVKLSTRGRKG